jgi:hypothetical protein
MTSGREPASAWDVDQTMDRDDHPFWNWRLAALLTAAVAVTLAAASVQRGVVHARARRLGVSAMALTNPERLLRKLRSAGL